MPAYQMNPDQMGPIVRNTADGKKQLVHARWGLPSPRFALEKAAKAKAEKLAAKGKPFDLELPIRRRLFSPTRRSTNCESAIQPQIANPSI
jgi:hypothetical protein